MQRMSEAKPHVADCVSNTDFEAGFIQVKITISGKTGVITEVELLAPHDARGDAALQSCVRRAFDGICFEPFAREEFYVSFPFKTP